MDLLVGLQQVVHQEGFVDCRSHLCSENGGLGVDEGLVFIAVIKMHGMPHLMSQCECAVQVVLVIKENKRMDTIDAVTVGTTCFTLSLVNVRPPGIQTLC